MRNAALVMLLAASSLHIHSLAGQQSPSVKQLYVHTLDSVKELECGKKSPAFRPPAASSADPMEIPTEEMIREMTPNVFAAAYTLRNASALAAPPGRPIPSKAGYRIAIWGDSHLAAGFFTEELAKLLKFPVDSIPNALIPANMGKAGVRLPIRQFCVSSQWKYEPGYLGGDSAAAPGPGLVSMFSDQAGSVLAWDVRKNKETTGYERVRILYQQTEAPMVIGISIDGDAEKEVTLDQKGGPAVLELVADQPIAQVKLRLVNARFRFHGLELLTKQATPFGLDVFGYPGATVAGWKAAQLDYLSAWFAQRDYQLVVLEFGTNEGNVHPFDLAAYRKTLAEAVLNMKTVFPAAACILIAPGDRGVLVRRSANIRNRNGTPARLQKTRLTQVASAGRAWGTRLGPKIDLLEYARIHAEIGRAQAEVAARAGCSAWSMQDAMGGPGHSYDWARQSPPLMAADLIHFTVAGYQRLAQQFARDMGWTPLPVRDE